MKITFKQKGETKGTVKFEEEGNANVIGTLYIRKHALPEPFPRKVTVEVTFE